MVNGQHDMSLVYIKVRANIRELYIHEINKNLDPDDLDTMKAACKVRGIKHNLGPITADLLLK